MPPRGWSLLRAREKKSGVETRSTNGRAQTEHNGLIESTKTNKAGGKRVASGAQFIRLGDGKLAQANGSGERRKAEAAVKMVYLI